jgi:hypothetical protein
MNFVVNPHAGHGEFEGWNPLGAVSLVAGSSGAGKSTVYIELLRQQANREGVFGRATNGLSFHAFLADRDELALMRTFGRMKLDPKTFPHTAMKRSGGDFVTFIDQTINAQPVLPKVILIEGLDALAEGDINQANVVSSLLEGIADLAKHYHIAVIGTVGSPKMKPKDAYKARRDQILGSSMWARLADTVTHIETEEGDDMAKIRVMTVLTRNNPTVQYRLEFKGGLLVESTLDVENVAKTDTQRVFFEYISTQLEPFTYTTVRRQFKGMSGTALNLALAKYLKLGHLIERKSKAGKLSYEWVRQ